MNIFVLHEHAGLAARMQCDRHVTKMCVETAQLLCFAHLSATNDADWLAENVLFKPNRAHMKHPCTLWLLEDPRNYAWAYRHLQGLLDEYDYRYDGLSRGKYASILRMLPALRRIPGSRARIDGLNAGPESWALAMGKAPECVGPVAVEAYRRFYIVDKNEFATWTGRDVPGWYRRGLRAYRQHGDIQKVAV